MKPFWIIAATLVINAFPTRAGVACEEDASRLVITRDGKHVLTYRKIVQVPPGVEAEYGRSGFIHPISTPSGRVLTDDYPLPHHSHQHGLFFAWKAATFEGENVNFWEPGKSTVRHERVLEIVNRDELAGFRVELGHWKEEAQVLRETWTVTVHADTGHIDFTSTQSCATDLPLAIEKYHYGGLAIRGSRQWFRDAHTSAGKGAVRDEFVEPCAMLTSEGLTQVDGNHSRPKWVCMSGRVDAAPVSITLIPHPGNFRYPQHVRLHPDMPYFCFMPAVEQSFRIEPGSPLVSRYRIVVADGEPHKASLDAVQAAFAREK